MARMLLPRKLVIGFVEKVNIPASRGMADLIKYILQNRIVICIVQIVLVGCNSAPERLPTITDNTADNAMIVIYWCGATTKPVPEVAFGTSRRINYLKLWKRDRPESREFIVLTVSAAHCLLDKHFSSGII